MARKSAKKCAWPTCESHEYTISAITYHDNGNVNERLRFCSLRHLADWGIGYSLYETSIGVDCTPKELANIDKAVSKLQSR